MGLVMKQVILRKTKDAIATAEEAAVVVESCRGQVLHRSDDTLLAELPPDGIEMLRTSLPGWVVSPQGPPIPVPDTRFKIRP